MKKVQASEDKKKKTGEFLVLLQIPCAYRGFSPDLCHYICKRHAE